MSTLGSRVLSSLTVFYLLSFFIVRWYDLSRGVADSDALVAVGSSLVVLAPLLHSGEFFHQAPKQSIPMSK